MKDRVRTLYLCTYTLQQYNDRKATVLHIYDPTENAPDQRSECTILNDTDTKKDAIDDIIAKYNPRGPRIAVRKIN